jgi:hypothetical protein
MQRLVFSSRIEKKTTTTSIDARKELSSLNQRKRVLVEEVVLSIRHDGYHILN